MPYPYPIRIEGLLVEEEVTYGTDPTPVAGTNGVRGVGRIWSGISSEWAHPNLREDVVSNSLIQVAPGAPRGRIMNLDYRVQLMGAGVAYASSPAVRPECDPLLMSCGMSRTHVDTSPIETVTYALVDTGHSSCTYYAYAGGKLFRVVANRGTWTWSPTAGGLGEIRFQLQGLLSVAPTEADPVPAITYDSVVPPAAVTMGFAIVPNGQSSWTPRAAGMEVLPGQEADRFDDPNAADGIEGFFIGDTQPRFSFTPRTEDLSDYDAYAHAASRLDHTIDLTLGDTQYNRVKLDVNLAYLMNDPQPAEDGRFAAWQAEYLCRDMALLFD